MPKKFYKHEYDGKYQFIKKWFDDREGKEFERKVDSWLSQFENEEREFLLECLKRYSYFRAAQYKYGIKMLYSNLLEKYPCWKKDSLIFKIYKEDASYSDNFFNDFWFTNNIKNECKQNIEEFIEFFDDIENYIFIDDYIGSGNTITKYWRKLLENYPKLKEKHFVMLSLYLTKSGRLALENFAIDNSIDLDIIYFKLGDKFFREGKYFSGQQLQDKLRIYNNLCDNIGISKKDRFGYENIQSLFTIDANTPNDTLGVFWKSNSHYQALMGRYHENESPLSKLIKNKRLKKRDIKSTCWVREIDSHQNLLFVGYCARKRTKFNFAEACVKFGLTPEQLNKKIDYAIDKGYLTIKENRFVETSEFWHAINKRKYNRYFEDFINEVFEEKTLDLKASGYIPLNFEKKFTGYK